MYVEAPLSCILLIELSENIINFSMLCDGRHSERPPSDSLTDSLDSLPHPCQLAAARSCDSETEMPLDLCSAQVSRTLPILCVSVDRRRSVDPGADAQALEATPSPSDSLPTVSLPDCR